MSTVRLQPLDLERMVTAAAGGASHRAGRKRRIIVWTNLMLNRLIDRGEFPLALSVSLDGELQRRVSASTDEQNVIARLRALWRCSCLFSDDSRNPYTWLLMRPTGVLEAVTADADRLDNDDEFAIARVDRIVRRVPVAV